ncbi:arsenate reductase family protein [Muribacter muris]|uniref:Arsenate reductase n=1 Tax=Muribacter muris TaxID=67855 RepID=A0A4Y9JUX7_9PAST|nr:arsenate reductase family protein [Muribacter muris]MBF0785362.1 arsenate reductase family protein [Muribacter muris]MBF0826017.1 arsenate reductase family protein [Muribacter muris]TFV09624.1 arsenate reductase family protein [Muribacter muris]
MITLYHNPKCSKSRETLAILQAGDVEVQIVEYLKTPLTAQTIERLIRESGISVQQAMRTDVAAYQQFIAEKTLSDTQLITLMATYPELLNRPFASGEKGTRFCRPPALVNELL